MLTGFLTAVLAIPIVGAISIALLPEKKAEVSKMVALVAALLATALSLALYFAYDQLAAAQAPDLGGRLQFVEDVPWIQAVGIHYAVGADGLSLPLVLLTGILTIVSIVGSWDMESKSYFALFLLMMTSSIGVFVSLDLILFFVFWELGLVPMYFIIAVWGGPNRRYAAIKFMIYSLAGSVLMLLAIIAVAWGVGQVTGALSFDLRDLLPHAGLFGNPGVFAGLGYWAFWGFMAAFLIKLPSFPVHTWLPDAHTEAPTAGSIMLAGILLKLGGYGILRFGATLFPDQIYNHQLFLATLATISIVYGALVAMNQQDLKKLVAYSSVNHMGYVLLGVASLTQAGLAGGVFQMLAHGVITGLLFLLVGLMSHRTETRLLGELGGLLKGMPMLISFLSFTIFASLGLPGLAGFIGEVLAFIGAFSGLPWVFPVVSLLGLLVTAGFFLWALQRTALGELPEKFQSAHLHDLYGWEGAAVVPLAALAVLLGVVPGVAMNLINTAVVPLAQALQAALAGGGL